MSVSSMNDENINYRSDRVKITVFGSPKYQLPRESFAGFVRKISPVEILDDDIVEL